jgi:hypothetical protein
VLTERKGPLVVEFRQKNPAAKIEFHLRYGHYNRLPFLRPYLPTEKPPSVHLACNLTWNFQDDMILWSTSSRLI